MLTLKDKTRTLAVDGYTVIIPSICVGNAAQLACDLLIASKELQRIGTITHPALIPVFGPSAYQHDPEDKCAACEVYEGAEDKLLVIQLRTPLISHHTRDFHSALAQLVRNALRVIILSGSFGFEKRVIEASPYEYRASSAFKEAHNTQLAASPWKEFTGEIIFGGGNSLQLYKVFEEQGTSVMLLFRYLLEGDNATDASLIVRELNDLCQNFLKIYAAGGSIKLTVPVSWKLLFGNDGAELIF